MTERVQYAADDHPDRQPARAEQHDRDGDDHGPAGGRDGQRRRAEPGVPGRRECHGVHLGTDDHRRQRWLIGGGLYNYGTTTLTNCTVSGNSASNGGGLYDGGGTTTLTNCTVSGNSASNGGGGSTAWHDHADQLHRQRQLRHGSGGGLYDTGGTTTLTNCTVSGNSAVGSGGGLFNSGGTTTLTNCTVSGNSAAALRGGGGLLTIPTAAARPR